MTVILSLQVLITSLRTSTASYFRLPPRTSSTGIPRSAEIVWSMLEKTSYEAEDPGKAVMSKSGTAWSLSSRSAVVVGHRGVTMKSR